MKYLLICISIFAPISAGAQLSSENFQIDSFSVGTNQSAGSESANFSVEQETGGLFIVDDTGNADSNDGSTLIGRTNTTTASNEDSSDSETSADGGVLEVLSSAPEEIGGESAAPAPDVGSGGELGSLENTGSTSLESDSRVPPVEFQTNRDNNIVTEITREYIKDAVTTCSGSIWCYFWYWWPLLLLLALYILWHLVRRW